MTKTKDLIRQTIATTELICNAYLEDLIDEEWLVRPVAGVNHIYWQRGHLIAAENMLAEMVKPGSMPKLPEGFVECYSKETATHDDPAAFLSKSEPRAVAQVQRAGLLNLLDQIDLDENTAALILSADSHWMMHAGHWSVTRGALGKPTLF